MTVLTPISAIRQFNSWNDRLSRKFITTVGHYNGSHMKNVCPLLLLLLATTAFGQSDRQSEIPNEDLNGKKTDTAAAAQKALAVISGQLKVYGLEQPVKVLRDRWGVAHIYAKNQHDLFFAQGVVAAQDRLFQMEMWKRAGQGRLAEILGPNFLPRDINARALRYRGDMQAEYESYSPDTRSILAAFTDGINAYISRLGASGGPGLPLEFQLAGFAPDAWRPEDCLNRMAAFSMTGNAFSELQHARDTLRSSELKRPRNYSTSILPFRLIQIRRST